MNFHGFLSDSASLLVLPRRVLSLGPGTQKKAPGLWASSSSTSGRSRDPRTSASGSVPSANSHTTHGTKPGGHWGKKKGETFEPHGKNFHGTPRPVEEGKSPPVTVPPRGWGRWDAEGRDGTLWVGGLSSIPGLPLTT